MRRPALYSRSTASRAPAPASPVPEPAPAPSGPRGLRRWRLPAWNDPRLLWLVIALLTAMTAASLLTVLHLMPRALTQKDIDGAVLKTLETVPLPSNGSRKTPLR